MSGEHTAKITLINISPQSSFGSGISPGIASSTWVKILSTRQVVQFKHNNDAYEHLGKKTGMQPPTSLKIIKIHHSLCTAGPAWQQIQLQQYWVSAVAYWLSGAPGALTYHEQSTDWALANKASNKSLNPRHLSISTKIVFLAQYKKLYHHVYRQHQSSSLNHYHV